MRKSSILESFDCFFNKRPFTDWSINYEAKSEGISGNNSPYILPIFLISKDKLRNSLKADTEQYKKAEKILSDVTVLPFEGATDSYRYYRQTKLMLAHNLMEKKKYEQALTKINEAEIRPRNLGIGKPFEELINNDIENISNFLGHLVA